jgi:ribosomal-protein-serine acetyltransferase
MRISFAAEEFVMNKMLLDLPARLETDRLIVRPYQAGDGPAYHDVCLRNKEHLLPYEAGNPALGVKTVEDAEILVREFAAAWVSRRAFFFGAWKKSDPAVFVAQLYVGAVNWDLPEFEVGYFVDQRYEGQGYVTEGVNAALVFAFDHLQAHRARLVCSDINTRSYRVAERCGFTREGHLRQTQNRVLQRDGSFSGEFLYGLLREEFTALRANR